MKWTDEWIAQSIEDLAVGHHSILCENAEDLMKILRDEMLACLRTAQAAVVAEHAKVVELERHIKGIEKARVFKDTRELMEFLAVTSGATDTPPQPD